MLSNQEQYENASIDDSAPGLKKLSIVLVSLVIIGVLTIQTTVSFCCKDGQTRLPSLGSVQSGPGLIAYKVFTPPSSWPFLDYPMYKIPYYEGSQVPLYRVVGILPDSTEVTIQRNDLGFTFTDFNKKVVYPFLDEDTQMIEVWVRIYESKYKKELVGLRLEYQPLILSKSGASDGEPVQVLYEIGLQSMQEQIQ